MRLMRIGEIHHERPVVLVDDDHYVDVSDVVADFNEDFFDGGMDSLHKAVKDRIASGTIHAFAGERIGSPIARPHQILAIGLNYPDHAKEVGQPLPDEPVVFTKSPNTIVGPNDDVRIPRNAYKVDPEVEIGIVIGKRASYLENEEEALAAIAGYMLVNDVTEREFQLERGGQMLKGKSAETFNPAGPWLATADEFSHETAANSELWLSVNGQKRQHGSTSKMLFGPAFLVRYLSQFMVLEPGDLINTSTPGGVGLGMKPPVYLQAGDVVELGIPGLGTQRQTIIAPR